MPLDRDDQRTVGAWETTTNYNLGVEFSLWEGRLSGNVDYYVKKTSDLLFWLSSVAIGASIQGGKLAGDAGAGEILLLYLSPLHFQLSKTLVLYNLPYHKYFHGKLYKFVPFHDCNPYICQ